MDEYASIRLTSACTTATTEPNTMVSAATSHTIGSQSQRTPGSATYATRSSAPNAAALVQAAMKPVTGVGAPWYTSGVQAWNGTALTLNSRPTASMPMPSSSRPSRPTTLVAI